MKREVLVRYHNELYPDLEKIKILKNGDFVDLACAETVSLKSGEFKIISLGVSIKCPEGYWMQLVPRSSTYNKYGIIQTNSFGVIDESYCGDNDIIGIPVVALRDTTIEKGARIAQFRIVEKVPFTIKEVDKLTSPDRGGFGSTGV